MDLSFSGLDPLAIGLIVATSFVGSAITAAFSIGGGLLLIAVMSALLPGGAVIPVHGAIMLGSNASRAGVFRRHVDLHLVGWFGAGALVGAVIGGSIVTTLPDAVFRLAVAGFILFTQWGPALRLPVGAKSIGAAGAVSTFLTLFVGASGPFITAVLATVERLERAAMVGTAAACMVIQHGLKCVVFAIAGFSFAPFLPLLAASIAAGFLGTVLGAKLLHRLEEAAFRRALKWLLTALAIYLIGAALAGLLKTG